MNKFLQKFIFCEKRIVFQVPETVKPPESPKSDQARLAEIGQTALDKARRDARNAAVRAGADRAKAAAGNPSAKPGEKSSTAPAAKPGDKPATTPAAKPAETKNLPELPKGLTGLKVDKDKAVTKDGRVEQQFKFGDLGVPGKIIMPEKPKDGAKTTIMFNYVDDPDKFDHGKFLEEMKKSKIDLGNTVIVTIRTPEATIKVNREQVNTMTQLVGEVEKFQQELSKDPKFKDLKLTRAENIMHMTSKGESEKVKLLLTKYQEFAADKDPRAANINAVLDNDPTNFVASLEKALEPAEKPQPEAAPVQPDDQGATAAAGGGASSGGGRSGGGGTGSGGGGSGGNTETPSAQSETAPTSESETPAPAGDTETVDQSKTNPEVKGEGIDRVLILGDSLLELTQKRVADHYKSNIIDTTAVRSKTLHQMLGELEARGKSLEKLNSDKCRGTIVVNGGVNDLAAGGTDVDIFADMEKMVEIAKKYKLKINFCALAPFGGTTYQSLQKDFDKKNEYRKKINAKLYALANVDGANVGVIPLDKGKSAGGLADDNDANKLDPTYASKDGLHLSIGGEAGKDGTEAMAAAIVKHLGEPVTLASGDKTPDTVKPPETGNPTVPGQLDIYTPKPEEKLIPYSENAPELKDLFSTWAIRTRADLLKAGLKPETYVKTEFNGKPLLAILRPHTIRGATGGALPPGTLGLETYEIERTANTEAEKKSPESSGRTPELRLSQREVSGGNFEKMPSLAGGEIELSLNYPKSFNPAFPTELIVYATPNGQAPERTNGSGNQIGRQADLLRSGSGEYRNKNLIIAYISPLSRKWEEYLARNPAGGSPVLRELTAVVNNKFHPGQLDISFDSHSGGGAFAFNIMNEQNAIPAGVRHLDFFDSLYYYHGAKHAGIIKKWLDSNHKNTFALVAGTPPIIVKQKQLISDLEKMGVTFSGSTDQDNNTEYSAYNGRVRIKVLNTSDHGGTVTRNGFAYAHDPENFEIGSRAA